MLKVCVCSRCKYIFLSNAEKPKCPNCKSSKVSIWKVRSLEEARRLMAQLRVKLYK